jgi:hypothetical protein
MKKFFSILFACGCFSFANATPGTGGYFGHRLIIGAEGSYSPFYSSFTDLFTHVDLQYGANIGVITCRRTQVNLFYNMYKLAGNDLYDPGKFGSDDRIKGTQFGITVRNFRKDRGGIAPIGKFYDVSLAYSMNQFVVGANNPQFGVDNQAFPADENMITPSVSFGTQGLFWGHVVANTGLRFGYPVNLSSGNYFAQRLVYKDVFSMFFGVGILL